MATRLAEHSFWPENGPTMLPMARTTRKMLLLAVCVSFAAWLANFDNGFAGVVIIMPSYNTAFGNCHEVADPSTGQAITQCQLSALQQSIISIGCIFGAVGGAISGPIGSYAGRRRSIQFACALSIIGAAGMLCTSGSFLSFMVCRCINNAGIGLLQTASIIYGAECVSAERRGLLLGLFNIGLAMGNVTVSAVCAGTATLHPSNNWQWRTPILCQIPLAIILGGGVQLFPESPRWLLVKGKYDEARQSFAILQEQHPRSPMVDASVRNIQRHIELETAMSSSASWTEIYRGVDLRRTMISSMILIALAVTGIQFVAPYAALFLSNVGITNPFLVNVIIGLCIFAGACFGPFALDYGGRRLSMLIGYGTMAICMLILSSVSTGLGGDSKVAKTVVVVFLCFWALLFGGFIGPSAWLASAEMHSVRLRTYGQANTTALYYIFAFGATFWTPYMLNKEYGNMGANVGYFYAGITLIVFCLVYLYVPETSGLSLEQIDDFFISGRKAWTTSTAKNREINLDEDCEELSFKIVNKNQCSGVPVVREVENCK